MPFSLWPCQGPMLRGNFSHSNSSYSLKHEPFLCNIAPFLLPHQPVVKLHLQYADCERPLIGLTHVAIPHQFSGFLFHSEHVYFLYKPCITCHMRGTMGQPLLGNHRERQGQADAKRCCWQPPSASLKIC